MYFLAFGWTLVFGSFCTWHCQHELLFTLSILQSAFGVEDQCTESHAPLRPLGPVVSKSIRFRSHRKRINKRSKVLRSIRIHTTCTVSIRFRLSILKCSKTIEFHTLKGRVEEVGTFQPYASHWISKKRQLHTVSLVPKLHAPHPWISGAVTSAISRLQDLENWCEKRAGLRSQGRRIIFEATVIPLSSWIITIVISKDLINLVTVFDATLTSRQTREKWQCLYDNLISNNFRRTAVLTNIWLVN